MWNATPD
jgi:hypothetical protein